MRNLDKVVFYICIFILATFLSPYFLFPENSYFLVHDNLNSNVIWYHSIASGKYFFASSDTIVPYMFNGIPRGCYPSELNLLLFLYYLFPPLIAYCINAILLHLIAFFGSILFLKQYILKDVKKSFIYLIALCYACLPFWPSGQISVAGMPLLLWAFLNIANNKNVKWQWSWLVVILFPFYSNFAFCNLFFIIAFCAVYLLFVLLKKTRMSIYVILAIAVFIVLSFITEYRLIYMQFFKGIVTHRSLYGGEYAGTLNFTGWIINSFKHFLFGQYHFYSLHLLVLGLTIPVFFITDKKHRMYILGLLLLMLTISFGFISSRAILGHKLSSVLIMKNVMQLRFIALYPLLTLMLFAMIIRALNDKHYYKIIYGSLILQLTAIIFLFCPKDYNNNEYYESPFYHKYISHKKTSQSFNSYYKKLLFDEVKREIPPGDYNVLVFGLESQLLLMSGYNTIDGYHYFYPVEKVLMLRKVIQPYLNEFPEKKISLGSRASVSKAIGKPLYSDSLKKMFLDFDILKTNNCRYIFSFYKINDQHIKLVKEISTLKISMFIYLIS